jgi:hypothetical protein
MIAAALLTGLDDSTHAEDIALTSAFGAILAFGFLVFPVVGALIASRRPGNPIGWLFCAEGFVFTLAVFAEAYASRALDTGSLPAGREVAALSTWLQGPVLFCALVFLLLLFPDGHLPSPRWRWVGWLAVGMVLELAVVSGLTPGPLDSFPDVDNPFGVDLLAGDARRALEVIGYLALLGVALASAISLVRRFRRATGDERQQLKWFGSAAGLLAVVLVVAPVLWSISTDATETAWFVLFFVAFGAIPIATGIAVLKYRLYDVDLIIRRTLVYGVLTGALAGLYFAIVLVLQAAFSSFTQGNELAIAGSTLAAAALFRPARARIQAFVDRRFYRRKYDAQRTLEAFSARLREEIDLQALTGELEGVARETMQPAHVSLWLRTPGVGT